MKKINEVAKSLGATLEEVIPYGNYRAKINNQEPSSAKIILVTATNPTKYGEGKTTVAIALNDALRKLNIKSVLTLREPSMGPVFGLKGGATGGNKATVIPEVDINLHFNGDFHAITSANNLICAIIDNEIFQGNQLGIEKVVFKRCIDMNDRALRHITLHNGSHNREEEFVITAASELMAIFCLSKNLEDLRRRIDKIVIGYNKLDEEIYVADLKVTDAVMSLLIEAFKPNLVQSLEENPVIIHGGPFANIAHGCSSLTSLNTASYYGDYVVTEAGFGADAGAFKFIDIVARQNQANPHAIVLVTTIRALKHNGNGSLKEGICNLDVHVENLKLMNNNIIVTLNKFIDDDIEDINYLQSYLENKKILFSVNDAYNKGSLGCLELAKKIIEIEEDPKTNYLYSLESHLEDKIMAYVKNICHAKNFVASDEIMNKIKKLDKYQYPICIAKTQYSISHDEHLLGYPKDYEIIIKNVELANGAEFIKVYFGNVLTLPGLNKNPSAKEIKVNNEEIILPR